MRKFEDTGLEWAIQKYAQPHNPLSVEDQVKILTAAIWFQGKTPIQQRNELKHYAGYYVKLFEEEKYHRVYHIITKELVTAICPVLRIPVEEEFKAYLAACEHHMKETGFFNILPEIKTN